MIRANPKPPLPAECRKIVNYACWLLRAAGLRADPAAVMQVIRSAPRTVAEGDAGRCHRRSLCIISLLAASDNPMTDEQYKQFNASARFWLDVWPLYALPRRQRLQRMIAAILGGFMEGRGT